MEVLSTLNDSVIFKPVFPTNVKCKENYNEQQDILSGRWFQGRYSQSVIHTGNGSPEYRAHSPQRFSISKRYVVAGEDLRKAVMPLKGKWLDVL